MKLKTQYLCTVLLSLVFGLAAEQSQCKDDNNEDVDWFILYKLPKTSKHSKFHFNGNEYYTMTSNKAVWMKSPININSSRGAFANTWKNFKKKLDVKLFYNDQPQERKSKDSCAHMKGALGFSKSENGFWIIHSVPVLPNLDDRDPTEFIYHKEQMKMAQSVLCLSIHYKDFRGILNALYLNGPNVYNTSEVSPSAKKDFPVLNDLLEECKYKKTQNSTTFNFLTISRLNITQFAKNKYFGMDLYRDFIAIKEKKSLYAETWSLGKGALESNCTLPYTVENIKGINFTEENGPYFSSTKDHSKWSISINSLKNYYWICIADINREEAQFHRGGGAACFSNKEVWTAFNKIVGPVDRCKTD